MNNASVLRGITNSSLKAMVAKALQSGWQLGEVTGTTHYSVIWPGTGEKVSFGSTVSDRNYYKSFARKVERISGVQLLNKHKHGKVNHSDRHGPKYTETTVPDTQIHARVEARKVEETLQQKVDSMIDLHKHLQLELLVLSMGGPDHATADHKNEAIRVIRKLYRLEEALTALNIKIPRLEE